MQRPRRADSPATAEPPDPARGLSCAYPMLLSPRPPIGGSKPLYDPLDGRRDTLPTPPPGSPDSSRPALRLMMLRRGIGFRSVLGALFLLFAVVVRAEDTGTVTLNFVNADIDAVVKAVGEITGLNFLVDPRVKGTVNIVSAHPIPKSLVYPTLLSALRMQGFAAVESEGVVKIVPEVDAKTQGGPVQRGAVSASGDRIVTQVIALRHESAAQMVTVLRPLISPSNTISAYIPNNAIIVTDFADNLKRIDQIVASLDHPPGEPVLVHVKNASALDIVAMLNRLLSDGPGQPGASADAQQRVSLVADPSDAVDAERGLDDDDDVHELRGGGGAAAERR